MNLDEAILEFPRVDFLYRPLLMNLKQKKYREIEKKNPIFFSREIENYLLTRIISFIWINLLRRQ